MCIELGYPDTKSERALLEGDDRRAMLERLPPKMDPSQLQAAQRLVREIRCAPALLDYVQGLLTHSRRSPALSEGLSPRAGLALLQAARAWALLDGRNHVLPDDVQAVLTAVAGHRLRPAKGGNVSHRARAEMVAELLKAVAVP
jgi:MoxR-like ATPase